MLMMKKTPSMYYRRKILLALIRAFGNESIETIKLQKLLFLFCRQQKKPSFDFLPYKYGCFSLQAARDLSILAEHYRLLKHDKDRWTCKGGTPVFELEPQEQKLVDNLLQRFYSYSGPRLVNHVYGEHPYFFIKSQREMNKKQTSAVQHQRDKINLQRKRVLFTIGYEGKSIDFYLNELIEKNIHVLCDTRKNPISMKYGFSRKQLRGHCKELDITYEHIPELGVASEKRLNLDNPEDYRTLFAEYDKQLPRQEGSLKRVMELLKRHVRIALTCFERESRYCHRHRISNYLQQNEGIVCRHL